MATFSIAGAPIVVNDRAFRKAIRGLNAYIGNRAVIFDAIGVSITGYVRETIEAGGRPAWAPLSVWTHMRTGRTKPLESLAQRITYRSTRDSTQIYFDAPSPLWNLTMHEQGYVIPERWPRAGQAMKIEVQGGKPIFLKHAKPSVVPARPVWPTQEESEELVMVMVTDWINKGIIEEWR